MATPPFQRARSSEHKEQRRQTILDAARTLGLRDSVRAVSLTDIAAEAGVHKSGVLRYFETREEVFLQLTAECWGDWAAAVAEELRTPGPRVAVVLTRTLADRPLFCDLLAHAPLHLERGVSTDAVRAFKLTVLDAVDTVRTALTTALPGLTSDDAQDLVAAVTTMAAGLWQTAHPPQTLARLYAEDPRLGHAAVDFRPRLERTTERLLAGMGPY
ncbi:TetR family transcriptional regulator [Streptomyces sp. NPDC026672]|uniref:TetR family transcriptional regulator n=1 Tax=unclassified Streptomyces TaxID=2593676 RepID=UPI0033E739F0